MSHTNSRANECAKIDVTETGSTDGLALLNPLNQAVLGVVPGVNQEVSAAVIEVLVADASASGGYTTQNSEAVAVRAGIAAGLRCSGRSVRRVVEELLRRQVCVRITRRHELDGRFSRRILLFPSLVSEPGIEIWVRREAEEANARSRHYRRRNRRPKRRVGNRTRPAVQNAELLDPIAGQSPLTVPLRPSVRSPLARP